MAGVAAGALGAALGVTAYLDVPGADAMPWCRLGPAVVLFAIVTGLCTGVFIGFGTLVASRRRTGLLRLALGGAIGGLVAGLIPGLFGIGGFGSLHGPYMGTTNILAAVLAGATTFVVLWGPRLLPARIASRLRPGRRIALAALAAIITASTVGLTAWSLVSTLGLVPTFATLKATAHCMGLGYFAIAGGAFLGTVGGAVVGLCCGVFTLLAKSTSR